MAGYSNPVLGSAVPSRQADLVFLIKEKGKAYSLCGHPQCDTAFPGVGRLERSSCILVLLFADL